MRNTRVLRKALLAFATSGFMSVAIVPRLIAASSSSLPATRPSPTIDSPVAERQIQAALDALSSMIRPLSDRRALKLAFRAYYRYIATIRKPEELPYLYFVDYGLPSTDTRGYVFDMSTLTIMQGPFNVAHGRGSSDSTYGVPTRFSNAVNSAATSLGLFRAQESYTYSGATDGEQYLSVGLRLKGLSRNYNLNALKRHIVVHGAPYVTPLLAGRSDGCPAIEQWRAERLLPQLANKSLVFLFAPDTGWMANDAWISESILPGRTLATKTK